MEWIQILKYILIPLISAIIGWGTNVVALIMTFYPLEFVGCFKPYIGWQGIVPSRAKFMANVACDLMVNKLIHLDEIFARLNPEKLVNAMGPTLTKSTEKVVNSIAMKQIPNVWVSLSSGVKTEVIKRAVDEAPQMVSKLMQEMQSNISDIFDVRSLIVETLNQDKILLNSIFLRCGTKEFDFIRRSGFVLGFIFGIIQLLVFLFVFEESWVLPVMGFFNGWITNVIALKMIFRPVNPIRVCCCTLQGLFLKRQDFVATVYGEIIAAQILTSHKMLENIVAGEKFHQLVDKVVAEEFNNNIGRLKQLIQFVLGEDTCEETQKLLAEHIIIDSPWLLLPVEDYADVALDIEATIQEKLKSLPSKDFEAMLHPVFEQDEWKLILVGAILGAIAGSLQILLLLLE